MMKILCIMLFAWLLDSLTAFSQPYSGTLPVVFIHTEDTIASKTDYVDGTYYIDAMGHAEFEAVGTAEEPLPLQIRGRGNWTWTSEAFPKKPYKIKLTEKTSLLGMAKNKHFALLAHHDGVRAFFRNAAAFFLSRELGMDWTPAEVPVELVLNGDYKGLYFLTETVRVGKHRVNITEQANGEKDSKLITGGWLVEIDNTLDDQQLRFSVQKTDLQWFWVTYHSPDSLSTTQRNYLRRQMNNLLSAVYAADKTAGDFEKMVDLASLARFYVINEVLDDVEAFLGSCFMYKERGDSTKWKFGPLWDMGHAFNDWHEKNRFLYDIDNWANSLIGEVVKFPSFQEEVSKVWNVFYPAKYEALKAFMKDYSDHISAAARCNAQRWNVAYSADTEVVLNNCLDLLGEKIAFLVGEWGEGGLSGVYEQTSSRSIPSKYYSLQGQQVQKPMWRGIYIKDGRKWFYPGR